MHLAMPVTVTTSGAVRADTPRLLFKGFPSDSWAFDVSPDGQRFAVSSSCARATEIHLVIN